MRGLYALKPWYTRRLGAVVRGAVRRGLSPDLFTVLGVLAAAAAGVAIGLGWWHVAAILLAGRLAGANLDGAVARAQGASRPWGFVLNELGDRSSDVLMFLGLAVLAHRTGPEVIGPEWFPGDPLAWTLLAMAAAMLPTVASLAVAGAGGPRLNGGPLGKTERCLVIVVATAFPPTIPIAGALVVVGSVLTSVTRLVRGRRELLAADTVPAPPHADASSERGSSR